MKKVYVILPLLCISAQIQAFSWHKCKKVMFKKTSSDYMGSVTSTTINYGLSSGQFTTSTGECSAMGMNYQEEKEAFYHLNFNSLRNDMSKGGGERLTSFYKMYKCSEDQMSKNNQFFKDNFKMLISENNEASFEEVDLEIDRTCYE